MFPAHAGMNRPQLRLKKLLLHVPRTRGDEPELILELHSQLVCSPHTRG